MVDRPIAKVKIETANRWTFQPGETSTAHHILTKFIAIWQEHFGNSDLRPGAISLEKMIPTHNGLGSGTQMSLAIGEALSLWHGTPVRSPESLALSVGRGQRSAIGTYGYWQGGFLVDAGHFAESEGKSTLWEQPRLETRVVLPAPWRFVLIQPALEEGYSAAAEANAFENLEPPPTDVANKLHAFIHSHILPAVKKGDFTAFSRYLGEFNRRSGEFFAPVQGSAYNGEEIEQMVRAIVEAGHAGVGQSSWGPTLFVAQPNETAANLLTTELPGILSRAGLKGLSVSLSVVRPLSHGRQICIT
jgi:beta-ribofuranosylaminobenzene 5'-phosphate synthase